MHSIVTVTISTHSSKQFRCGISTMFEMNFSFCVRPCYSCYIYCCPQPHHSFCFGCHRPFSGSSSSVLLHIPAIHRVGINASSLSLTAFTVERYIAICHTMKAQSVCTVKRAKKIILGVWAFAFCYSAPWLGLTTTEPINYKGYHPVEMCTFKLSRKEYLVGLLLYITREEV